MEEKGGWTDVVTGDLADFIAARDSFYLATTSGDGQPYAQHRGGEPGFLKVLDENAWERQANWWKVAGASPAGRKV